MDLVGISDKQNRTIPPGLLDVARVSMGVNLAREAERLDFRLQAQLKDIA